MNSIGLYEGINWCLKFLRNGIAKKELQKLAKVKASSSQDSLPGLIHQRWPNSRSYRRK